MSLVLVVDDEAQNRYLLEVLLRGSGHEVVSAANGEEALRLARAEPPALVVTDILMPVMDGFVLCREWKGDPALKSIPLVFYTATYTEAEDERFALSLGADRFLRKPTDPDELLGELERVLSRARDAQPPPTPSGLEAEIAFLAAHDEAMARKLEKRHAQLQRSERRYRSYFDRSPVATLVLAPGGRIQDANAAACRLSGFSTEELGRLGLSGLLCGQDLGAAPQATGEGPVLRVLRCRDGALRDVAVTRVRLDDGTDLAFCEDVTDRNRAEEAARSWSAELERRVAERTLQLEQANRELDAFAHSASHDLRAPLRAIDGYAALLETEVADRLEPRHRELLDRIRLGAVRMSALITDLLGLAHAGRQGLSARWIDVDALVAQVVGEVLPEAERSRTELTVGPLPPALADEGLLRQVFTNLLSNAVKFSAPRARRSIEVGSERVPDGTRYHVKDNGVGFDPALSNRLFGAFQRLHGLTEFEGTGLGLALVRRIVERHGGRVFAQGEPDRGATFGFVLPGPARDGGGGAR